MRTIYRVLAGVIGAVLSAAGCSDDGVAEYGSPSQPEYGVPRADFRLSGRVLDGPTGQVVPGFEVRFADVVADTTDTDGRWRIEASSFPCDQDCSVQLQDIDGTANGSYLPHVQPLDLEQTIPGDDEWFAGQFEQHDLDIRVEPSSSPRRES